MAQNSSNNVYIITEKIWTVEYGKVNSNNSYSVFVTESDGHTKDYLLPHFYNIVRAHDSVFNVILNGITTKGYRIF